MVVRNGLAPRVGVAVVSINHTLAWVDERFGQLVGYTPGELIGQSFESITHLDDLDLDRHLADRLFRAEIEEYEMEKRYIHKDQTVIPIHLKVQLLRDRSGAALYALSTVEAIDTPVVFHVHVAEPLTPREAELDRIRRAIIGA